MQDRSALISGIGRAAARKGVLRVAAFLMLTVITFVVTAHLIDRGLRRIDTSIFGVYNGIVNGRINAGVIISGSSRALNHFDPRIIRNETGLNSFNIGINGSQTDMQLAVLKTYLRHNAKPDLVIQSLDSYTFVTSRSGVWFPGQYLPYLYEDDIYRALNAVDSNTWKAKRLPLYGYAVEDMNFTWMTGLRGLFGWNPKEDRYLGFQPRYASWSDEFARFRDVKHDGVRFEIETQGLQDFEELLRMCRDRSITVLLVYSPVYYEMQALEINREETFRHFEDIGRRYGATFWDYSHSPISYRKDYFVNSQHLNADGAAAFSAKLAADLAASPFVRRKIENLPTTSASGSR